MTRQAGDSHALVLLHSGGGDETGWDFVPLGDLERRVIRHVFPGHGSRLRRPESTIEELADEVVRVAPEGADLLGAAFGGMVALHALSRHPDHFRSAVLMCTTASMAGRREVLLSRARAVEEQGLEPVIQETIERWFTRDAVARKLPVVDYAARTLRAMSPGAYADLWRWMAWHDMPAASLASIAHPVTLLAARGDAALGVEAMESLSQHLKISTLTIVSGPHLVHLERPDVVTRTLSEHYEWLWSLDA